MTRHLSRALPLWVQRGWRGDAVLPSDHSLTTFARQALPACIASPWSGVAPVAPIRSPSLSVRPPVAPLACV